MRSTLEFVKTTVFGGVLVIVPVVVVVLLLGRVIGIALGVIEPIASLLPGPRWMRDGATVVLLVGVCFSAGAFVRTALGDRFRRAAERRLERVPGFTLVRSLARRIAGEEEGTAFQVALVEIEEALVPAFLVEEHDEGKSFTVFVPAAPTPAAGAVYILPRERVHKVDVPFAKAVSCMTRWGSGTGELLRAMRRAEAAPA